MIPQAIALWFRDHNDQLVPRRSDRRETRVWSGIDGSFRSVEPVAHFFDSNL